MSKVQLGVSPLHPSVRASSTLLLRSPEACPCVRMMVPAVCRPPSAQGALSLSNCRVTFPRCPLNPCSLGRGHDCPSVWGSGWKAQCRRVTEDEDGETYPGGEDQHLCPLPRPAHQYGGPHSPGRSQDGGAWAVLCRLRKNAHRLCLTGKPQLGGKCPRGHLSPLGPTSEPQTGSLLFCPWSAPVIAVQSGPRCGSRCLRTPCPAS